MNIGLVGYGYWGKILYKNLTSLDHKVVVCESAPVSGMDTIKDYRQLDGVDSVFIAVPCMNHFEVCKHFIDRGMNVFCEKPLTIKLNETKALYELAAASGSSLFVDWVFIFNQQVNAIKSIVDSKELGQLRSVSMRRLNKGPIRYDVDSLYDLSSHDLSILLHIMGVDSKVERVLTNPYKTNAESVMNDSFFGVYRINGVPCTVSSSWEHPIKDRGCVFEFDGGVVLWDDTTQSLKVNGNPMVFHERELPLLNSIKKFLHNDAEHLKYQKHLTLGVMEILDHEIQ